MNIVIAGIYRSGSTWLFNAVRFMTEEAGLKTQGSFIWWKLKKGYDCHVIKTHFFYPDEELQFVPDFIITSNRNRKDIIESMKAQVKKGLDPQFANAGNHKGIRRFSKWLNYWRRHKKHVYEMKFRDLREKKIVKILNEINESLQLNLNSGQIKNVELRLSRMRPPKEGFGKKTLLTPTHKK